MARLDLFVLVEHKQVVQDLINARHLYVDSEDVSGFDDIELAEYSFDVRDNDLGIENELMKHCIPYDKCYEDMCDLYSSTTKFRVLADGTHELIEVDDATSDSIEIHKAIKMAEEASSLEELKLQLAAVRDERKSSVDWPEQKVILEKLKLMKSVRPTVRRESEMSPGFSL